MGEQQHTPGPWTICAGDPYRVGFNARYREADQLRNHQTNARLIAAAPDILDALRECEEFFDQRADVDDGIPNDAMNMLVIVRTALSKATGE
jgi:hypothetical protein